MARTMITAHSGCDGTPDNSIEFLKHAMTCAADALEIDIQKDSAGRYYLSHDESAGGGLGLREAFAVLRDSDKLINCDLKKSDMELDVLSMADELGLRGQILFSGDVSSQLARENHEIGKRTLLNLSSAVPELAERFNRARGLNEADIRRLAQACRSCGARAVNIPHELCTDKNLDLFAEEGVVVSAWTVNDEAVARRLLARGVCNITTRNTRLVCNLRAEIEDKNVSYG